MLLLVEVNAKSTIGKLGEDLACDYLKSKGYRIFTRNYGAKIGEIDIVAIDRGKTLVFFEIKTMKEPGNAATDFAGSVQVAGLMPEDNLTRSKIQKLSRICEVFISKNPDLVHEERGWRIDLLAITLDENFEPIFRHYENIF